MTRKIIVTNTLYPDSIPNGTVMTITSKEPNGCVNAVKDGDSFPWFIDAGTFHVLDDTPIKLEVGKWYELNNGDVVECVRESYGGFVLADYVYEGNGEFAGGHADHLSVKREVPAPTPTLWRDMTDAEKGALLLAKHEGKVIEWNSTMPGKSEWEGWTDCPDNCLWEGDYDGDGFAYRVKSEPVRETVTLTGGEGTGYGFYQHGGAINTHKITFDTADGVPVCDSIRMDLVS